MSIKSEVEAANAAYAADFGDKASLALPPARIAFVSSNGWDACAAKANGYRVLWCNRFGQAPERIPEAPDAEIASLAELPAIVGC